MYHVKESGKSFINRDEYRDKVLGCWTGKNIGGTLGAPFEGKRSLQDVKFYTQELKGNPAPNDDLDLQLAWLDAVEEHGLYNVNERVLGEYWLDMVCGPWGEYGIAKFNMRNGLLPPLSGFCNNEMYHASNGAWIRSEIWGCLFPGEPEEAAHFAWFDSCVDHYGDGIYAEIFTASLEAAAFVESDLRKLIGFGLLRIPEDCRIARSVKLAVECYDKGDDWVTARNKIVEDSKDLGWFQAPANVAFTVIGLLYGEGDFGKSICTAVNCGDDTDCTGATCGAILGIIKGRSGLPKEWIEPIGETIQTVAINTFGSRVPKTLDELTDRVIACKKVADAENPTLMRLTDGPTVIDQLLTDKLADNFDTVKFILSRPSNQLQYDLPFGSVFVQFEPSPVAAPDSDVKLKLSFGNWRNTGNALNLHWQLPEGWYFDGGKNDQLLMTKGSHVCSLEVTLHIGEFSNAFEYIPVRVNLTDRQYPSWISIPFQCRGTAAVIPGNNPLQIYWDSLNRILARQK